MKAEKSLTNSQLKKHIDSALTQFSNWKVEMNTNPNPKLVHHLNNILTVISGVVDLTNMNIEYSYKLLSKNIAELNRQASNFNIVVIDSLIDDDSIDEKEEANINEELQKLMRAAVNVIQVVQGAFKKI